MPTGTVLLIDDETQLRTVVLMAAYGTVADGVRAAKAGAYDYLTKGNADDQLLGVVERAVEKNRPSTAWPTWSAGYPGPSPRSTPSTGTRQPWKRPSAWPAKWRPPTPPCRWVPHGRGQRAGCPSCPRGQQATSSRASCWSRRFLAFAGAQANKKGLIKEANGGSLFLAKIDKLELQAKLLRALESQEFLKMATPSPPV